MTLIHGNFGDLGQLLDSRGISGLDGMLFDLGVSLPSWTTPERGFSYMQDAPLDMRYGPVGASYRRHGGEPVVPGGTQARSSGSTMGGALCPQIAAAIVRRRAGTPHHHHL
ncbi:MAG: 16S rRNA (cytosine(1402)-N(4))-methyltransferase [Intestinimonas sp.]